MIRIVAGKVGGRRLSVPKGSKVRPTADRVREALFSSLSSRFDNAKVLDLFAGSGAFGLEALSRGAASAVFVEKDKSVRATLKENIETLGLSADSTIIALDALKAVAQLKNERLLFDIAFLDPPYAAGLLEKTVAAICDADILAPGASLVAEHPSTLMVSVPNNLQKVATRSYGDTGLTFFEKEIGCQCR